MDEITNEARVWLNNPKTWKGSRDGKYRGVVGDFVEPPEPAHSIELDGQPGIIEAVRRNEFEVVK